MVMKNGFECVPSDQFVLFLDQEENLLLTLRGFVYLTGRKSVSCVPTLPVGTVVYLHWFGFKTAICIRFVVLFQILETNNV